MACSRKVYSYGAPNKAIKKEKAPWLSTDEVEIKIKKLPPKKGVWSKGHGQLHKNPSPIKIKERKDPFEFDDIDSPGVNDSNDDDVVKDSSDDDPFTIKNLKNNHHVKEGMKTPEKVHNPNRTKTIKSRVCGKLLPQEPVTISVNELKLFGSPRKNGFLSTEESLREKSVFCKRELRTTYAGCKPKYNGVAIQGLKESSPKNDNDEDKSDDDSLGGTDEVRITSPQPKELIVDADKRTRVKSKGKDFNQTDNKKLNDNARNGDHTFSFSQPTQEEVRTDETDSDNEILISSSCPSDFSQNFTIPQKTVFSFYGNHGKKIKMKDRFVNKNLSSSFSEFDFSSTDNDSQNSLDNDDYKMTDLSGDDIKTTVGTKRESFSPGKQYPCLDGAKKSKIEKMENIELQKPSVDYSSKDSKKPSTLDSPKLRVMFPFKSCKGKKTSPQKKNLRRFSSLPTSSSDQDHDDMDDEDADSSQEKVPTPQPLYKRNIFDFGNSANPVRVRRDEKELYTVVRNTKHAYECLDLGETQQFKDDLEYLLDGLRSVHSVSTRCLSVLDLASKCTLSTFRMHMKAHGMIENIFTLLEDAFIEEKLLLCASMLMFVLARDKLKINFNRKTIEFMLQVITRKRDEYVKDLSYQKVMKKIRNIFEKLEYEDINTDSIDATVLAREALLTLKVQRTGEWFKDEIRVLGGLDDIADIVYGCSKCIQKRMNVDQNCLEMKRCLVLFYDVCFKSTVNKAYLSSCQNSIVIESCIRTLLEIATILEDEENVTTPITDCLIADLKLLIDLTHENKTVCSKICKQEKGLDSLLSCILEVSKFLPREVSFEVVLTSLIVLTNISENNPDNIDTLNKTRSPAYHGKEDKCFEQSISMSEYLTPVESLMQMFVMLSEASKDVHLMDEIQKLEEEEDELFPGKVYHDDEYALTCGDNFEDTLEPDGENKEDDSSEDIMSSDMKMSHNSSRTSIDSLTEKEKQEVKDGIDKMAQQHMEDSYLAAHVALLLGLMAEKNIENQKIIYSLLPNNDFDLLTNKLTKIANFMEMTNDSIAEIGFISMQRMIVVIKSWKEHFTKESETQ